MSRKYPLSVTDNVMNMWLASNGNWRTAVPYRHIDKSYDYAFVTCLKYL